jgi:hypothetical protein
MSPRFEPITGRYLHLDLLGKPHRFMSRKREKAFPYSACTPPAPMRASSAA